MSDDEQIADAVLDIAVAATSLLTVADALALHYGPQTVRNALLVALAEFAARDLGEQGMLAEVRTKIEAITADPVIEAAIKWLH